MLASGVLDVVIGLAFIFLLYSLLATSVSELVAVALNLRARMLYHGIATMLTDTPLKTMSWGEISTNFFKKGWVNLQILWRGIVKGSELPDNFLHEKFFRHPLIKNYGQSKYFLHPSYIPPANFPFVLLDILTCEAEQFYSSLSGAVRTISTGTVVRPKTRVEELNDVFDFAMEHSSSFLPVETARILKGMLDKAYTEAVSSLDEKQKQLEAQAEAGVNVAPLTSADYSAKAITLYSAALETWFNDQMRRVSSWYKRQTQLILMVLGFFMAVFFNIDTIAVANRLSVDKEARTQLVSMAVAYTEKNKTAPAVPGVELTAGEAAQQRTYDSLVNFSRHLLMDDIGKANNLLSIGYNGFGQNDKPFRQRLLKFEGYAGLVADSARAELERLSRKNKRSEKLLAVHKHVLGWALDGHVDSLQLWHRANELNCAELVNQIVCIDSLKVALCERPDSLSSPEQCAVDAKLALRDSLATLYHETHAQWKTALRFGLADKLPALLKDGKTEDAGTLTMRYKFFTDSLSNAIAIDKLKADNRARDYGYEQLYEVHHAAIRTYYVGLLLCSKTLIGFLITAFAISLGAPFWFDLLNKFVNIRGSIKEGKNA